MRIAGSKASSQNFVASILVGSLVFVRFGEIVLVDEYLAFWR